jgi:hypothetical protein
MIRFWKHILPFVAAIVLASCSKHEVEVIPRSKMADIYTEMFMTDQWITSTPGMRMIADTSLVYEPILEKYGHDKMDYMHSVDFYMHDPERFSRILRACVDKLDKRIKHLRKMQRQQELEAEAAKKLEKFLESFQTEYSFEEYFPYLADEPYVHYYDSLTFEPDSMLIYRLVPIERADTLYDRLEMIVRADSLSVCDSVPVTDSLKLDDQPEKIDSAAVKKTPSLKKINDRKDVMPIVRDTMPKKKNLNTDMIWQQKE